MFHRSLDTPLFIKEGEDVNFSSRLSKLEIFTFPSGNFAAISSIPHCFNVTAQSGNIHIGSMFQFGDG